jgi:hypothetical protein
MNNNNYRFPEIMGEMDQNWLIGFSSGQLLNGDHGYIDAAPIVSYAILVVEFKPLQSYNVNLPGFYLN